MAKKASLRAKVIANIYAIHPIGWDANMVVRWSQTSIWKAIARGFHLFSQFTRLALENGERIQFWDDFWWGGQLLCSQHPYICSIFCKRPIHFLVFLLL